MKANGFGDYNDKETIFKSPIFIKLDVILSHILNRLMLVNVENATSNVPGY